MFSFESAQSLSAELKLRPTLLLPWPGLRAPGFGPRAPGPGPRASVLGLRTWAYTLLANQQDIRNTAEKEDAVTNQNWMLFTTGAAVGAGVMCLLDPGRGARRRALVRDQVVRASHKTADGLDVLSRDVANRARGVAAEAWGAMHGDHVGTRKLVERVRAELGRVVSHPRAIHVIASDGCVCLTGPILSAEVDPAVAAIRSVRGVCDVEDRLERHETAEGVPSLQGGRVRSGRRPALMQEAWSPTTKALMCIAGTALAAGLGYATIAPSSDTSFSLRAQA